MLADRVLGNRSYADAIGWDAGGGVLRTFDVVVERDPDTGLFVGSVPGWPGARSEGTTRYELEQNPREVIAMLLEDGEPRLESELVGLLTIRVERASE